MQVVLYTLESIAGQSDAFELENTFKYDDDVANPTYKPTKGL